MKTIKFIGMALFAILMCVNFTSCSNDDLVTTKGKKLVKIEEDENIYLFSYDAKGRLIESKCISDGEPYVYNSYTWEDNTITTMEIRTNGNTSEHTLNIHNGLVKGNDYYSLSYNSSKKPIFWDYLKGETHKSSFIWEEDKLISYYEKQYSSEWKHTFYYDNISCKKSCFHPKLFFVPEFVDYYLSWAHPEILGMQTTQLPTKETISYKDSDEDVEINRIRYYYYEFDKDGYVSKIIINEENYDYADSYTLTWE